MATFLSFQKLPASFVSIFRKKEKKKDVEKEAKNKFCSNREEMRTEKQNDIRKRYDFQTFSLTKERDMKEFAVNENRVVVVVVVVVTGKVCFQ